jgi:ATP-dependent Clp protease ATP-binding subunit ClpC
MFERFTERARKVVGVARDAAGHLNENDIGTQHLLLALLFEDEGVAARALASLNVTIDEVGQQVVSIRGPRPARPRKEGTGAQAPLPLTPRAKKVLEQALTEGLQLGHYHIGSEHILLALVRESVGVAAHILSNLDVEPDKVRWEVEHQSGERARQGVEAKRQMLGDRRKRNPGGAPAGRGVEAKRPKKKDPRSGNRGSMD